MIQKAAWVPVIGGDWITSLSLNCKESQENENLEFSIYLVGNYICVIG